MGGDVNPLEWIVPPIALVHESFNAATKTAEQLGILPSRSPRQFALAAKQKKLSLGTPIAPQTAQEEEASRRRALVARQALGQSTRASDQLTMTLG